MTKKHFIKLADVIKRHQGQPTYFTLGQQYDLADFCASQNPRFDRDRWLGYIAGTNGPNGERVKP